MFKKFPVSPLSIKIVDCLGNISEPEKPNAADNSDILLCMSAACVGALKNTHTCAPPLLVLPTTAGILCWFSLETNCLWSTLYSSMSIAPQLQVLSLRIGIIPIPVPPFKCSSHISSVVGSLITFAVPCFLPSLDRLLCTIKVPCAMSLPENSVRKSFERDILPSLK